MSGTERQAELAELVREQGRARVEDLARRFNVSPQTIRKDVNDLCARGLLRRIHGGVELAGMNADHYALRRIHNITAKRQIAQAAASIIPDDVSVAVSLGTTPELVVSCLGQHSGLRLFTNNLHVAMTAYRFHGAQVTIPGGTLRRSEADIVGPTATRFFDAYKVDFGLFGVAAVDADGGLLDLSEEDVHAREAISRNCATRILVLDASKFGRAAHARSGSIADVEYVICDTRPPGRICQILETADVSMVICDGGAR